LSGLQLQSLGGLFALLLLARLWGPRPGVVRWQTPLLGLLLTVVLAGVLLKTPEMRAALGSVSAAVAVVQVATTAGTGFVFGYLGGGPTPFEVSNPGASFVLAFQALPLLIVLGALTRLLNYWGVLPRVVRGLSLVLTRSLGLSGPVGLAATANIFLGMVEAPLFIQPYLGRLNRSEFFILMATGMSTIAGTVFVLYAQILGPYIPDVAGHLLVASVLSVPTAISVALLMEPAVGPPTHGDLDLADAAGSSMEAVTEGADAGMRMALQIAGLLITLLALVHLVNSALGNLPAIGGVPVTLQSMLGLLMAPIAWLMGIPWSECAAAGSLLGIKTVLNEFLAYISLTTLPPGSLSPRSTLILTYALCGFANIGSLAIIVGGLSSLVPERRAEVLELGWRSIIAGTLATCLTGAVIGLWTAP
jgi:concentrative nucleoside transporter, CNT family